MISVRPVGEAVFVELGRPEKLNAITPAMLGSLLDAFDQVEQSGASLLVLQGAGGSFCAGRDLDADWGSNSAEAVLQDVINPVVSKLYGLSIPTLAIVQGYAIGLGLALVLACDLSVASRTCTLMARVARRPSLADGAAHFFLIDRTGTARGLDMLWTGRALTGAEAAAAGLISRAVDEDNLAEERDVIVSAVTSLPPAALQTSKAIARTHVGRSTRTVVDVLQREAVAHRGSLRGRIPIEGERS
ncbi:MAG: enoyl-CoA hydratase/isomerase family protein [Acidimicrobiales bacterium]